MRTSSTSKKYIKPVQRHACNGNCHSLSFTWSNIALTKLILYLIIKMTNGKN